MMGIIKLWAHEKPVDLRIELIIRIIKIIFVINH